MLAMLILFRLGESEAGPLITLAVGTFMVPSLLLSGLGGEMADAHDKAWLARRLKFAEILVQMIAAAGLWLLSLPLLYTALFGLGVISALFGPVKYGILPDLLAKQELMAGNALVEAATFIAIFLGLIAGGLSAKGPRAGRNRPSAYGHRHRLFRGQSFYSADRTRRHRVFAPTAMSLHPPSPSCAKWRKIETLWTRTMAVSWFWMSGAIALSLVPVVVRNKTGGGIEVETAVSALFALGIGIGSISAAVIAHGRIYLKTVPFAAFGMAAFLIDLGGGDVLAAAGNTATWGSPNSSRRLRVCASPSM